MSYEFQGRTRARVEAERGRRARPATEPRAVRAPREGRSLVQVFAAVVAAVFLLVGMAGFIPGLTSDYDQLESSGPESVAKVFGLFQMSVLHNIVHLLFAVGLLAAARYSWSRLYLIGGGVVYLVVTLYGAFVDQASDANFMPFNGADNVLHLVLALGMIAVGVIGSRLSEGTPATRT